MNPLCRIRIGLVLAIAGILLGPVKGAADDYQDAKTAVDEALATGKTGNWESAAGDLVKARSSCADGDSGKPCRLLIDFNLGYAWEQYSGSAPAASETLYLKRSAVAYFRVLKGAPKHRATLKNLALVLGKLGASAALIDLLGHARTHAPSRVSEIAILLGDAFKRSGQITDAYKTYAEAAMRNRDDPEPARRLVGLMRELPSQMANDLWKRLDDWRDRMPGVARDGYRRAVRYYIADSPIRARQALSRWALLSAGERDLSTSIVRQAFAGVEWALLDQLLAYLEELEGPNEIDFETRSSVLDFIERRSRGESKYGAWLASEESRHVLAAAALAAGHRSILQKAPRQAQFQWLVGLQASPLNGSYVHSELRQSPFVRLDLLTELMWLQFRFPELDPARDKVDGFIRMLFEGKGEAYAAGDLEAIQRHHTVLGEIYAAEGIWTSSSPYSNAIFQLRNAIETADRRDVVRQVGPKQQLPKLKELLATGYAKTGNKKAASKAAMAASLAYQAVGDAAKAKSLADYAKDINPIDKVVIPKIRCRDGNVRNRKCTCRRGWRRVLIGVNAYRCFKPKLVCRDGRIADGKCTCSRGWRRVPTGVNAFRCFKPKLVCRDGRIAGGRCTCSRGWRRAPIGVNAFHCFKPKLVCRDGRITGGKCACSRGWRRVPIGVNAYRCFKPKLVCRDGRIAGGKCTCSRDWRRVLTGVNAYRCFKAKLVCQDGRIVRGKCICSRNSRRIRTGVNAYRCVKPKLVCRNGEIKSGKCICPRGTKLSQVVRNVFVCR